jgi:hypothetical protein
MTMIMFLLYYCKLNLGILLHVYETANPLDLKWRWNHFQYKYRSQRHHKF